MISMTRYVLLFEPYEMLAEMLTLSLNELGFEVDIGDSLCSGDEAFRARRYECVFINLDQSFKGWHSRGLLIANKASDFGLPVVMIPDNADAQDVIRAKGWLQINKPFKLAELKDVMQQATWARNPVAGSA